MLSQGWVSEDPVLYATPDARRTPGLKQAVQGPLDTAAVLGAEAPFLPGATRKSSTLLSIPARCSRRRTDGAPPRARSTRLAAPCRKGPKIPAAAPVDAPPRDLCDAAVSGAVVFAGLVILWTGQRWVDPVMSLVVAGVIFDAAEDGQAILLFDEADSLFAKRTEVRSSNDRYANLEVAHLVELAEAHGGVIVLATNMKSNVDTAFTRRLRIIVDFPPPADRRNKREQTRLKDRGLGLAREGK